MGRLLVAFLAALCFTTAAEAPEPAAQAWWKHVQYLASDNMEGRGLGSRGFDSAAAYVAEQFDKAGLKPAFPGYFQLVEFTRTLFDESRSGAVLLHGGKETPVRFGVDAVQTYSSQAAAAFEAPLVFAGFGLKVPESDYDDLRDLPIKGAVVAFLQGGPESIPGNLLSHYGSPGERWKAFRAAGAVGMISIQNPRTQEIPWERYASGRGRPRVELADASLAENTGLRYSATWNPANADLLLTGGDHSFLEILEAANSGHPLPRFAIPARIRAVVSMRQDHVRSRNIVGILMGTDPVLRAESIVISAHLDHLGMAAGTRGDRIYNGAMDNASGVASLIEIARAFAGSKTTLRRSLVFLTPTAEENGELGSRYYAGHSVPGLRTRADFNMDMYLPLFPLKWLEVQGLNESTLGEDTRVVAAANGVGVQADKEPGRNLFIRSDQYSFIRKGIPALAFKFGYVPGQPEERIYKDWFANRYHGVTDDLAQPVDLPGAVLFDEIVHDLILRVANADQSPTWNAGSFFRRFQPGGRSDKSVKPISH